MHARTYLRLSIVLQELGIRNLDRSYGICVHDRRESASMQRLNCNRLASVVCEA
jgi:hypothetical protein